MSRITQPRILVHADGNVYCEWKNNNTFVVILTESDDDEPIPTGVPSTCKWMDVEIYTNIKKKILG